MLSLFQQLSYLLAGHNNTQIDWISLAQRNRRSEQCFIPSIYHAHDLQHRVIGQRDFRCCFIAVCQRIVPQELQRPSPPRIAGGKARLGSRAVQQGPRPARSRIHSRTNVIGLRPPASTAAPPGAADQRRPSHPAVTAQAGPAVRRVVRSAAVDRTRIARGPAAPA